ncbi:hypothetical protein GCM10009555_034040 [Acrocarpospora macrocephala]|uniref:Signal peptidase I n=2 Tax=Acrocarpospora macrocephala TaxID=150177 RepID=A0A5M3WBZ9_9ACTN|nr:hypothetical protein Amac_001800 [Acrocarpospora macrocephala]
MEPTIKAGGHVMAAKPRDDYAPELGDAILFRAPESRDKDGVYISRVIGVPGATIEYCDNQGRIILDGQPLEEPYIKEPPTSLATFGPLTVPKSPAIEVCPGSSRLHRPWKGRSAGSAATILSPFRTCGQFRLSTR